MHTHTCVCVNRYTQARIGTIKAFFSSQKAKRIADYVSTIVDHNTNISENIIAINISLASIRL